MGDDRESVELEVRSSTEPGERSRPASTPAPWLSTSNSVRLSNLSTVEYVDDQGVCRVHPRLDLFTPNQSIANYTYKSQDELWRERIGEDSIAFDHVAHVCAPNGVRVRTAPHSGADELGIIPFDTRLHVERRTTHGWCYVTVLPQDVGVGTSEISGASGFVEGRFLLLDPPDTRSFLHYVQPGEGAAEVAAKYFKPPDGFTTGYDAYLFVSALWETNRAGLQTGEGPYATPMTRKPVSLSRWKTIPRYESEEQSMRIYLGSRLREDHALWIPSLERVMQMKSEGLIESAAIFADSGFAGGFFRGLIDGIADGVKDLVEDAKAVAQFLWDVIVEGKLVERLTEFAEKIGKLIEAFKSGKAMAAAEKLVVEFIEKWTHADDFLRGHFQGHVTGYLIVLILPTLLTGAAGLLARAPRAARILTTLAKVLDPIEAAGDLAKTMRAGGVADKLLASNMFRDRSGILSEPFEGGLPAIKQNFDPHLRSAFPEDEPFGGFIQDRTEGTQFFHEDRVINFTGQRNMNKVTVAEEVQHALDYTKGAKDPDEIAAIARKAGIPEGEINNWWHRRVFTRMIKNIDAEQFGLAYLKPRIDEIYELYKELGGKLTLDQIRKGNWKGLY